MKLDLSNQNLRKIAPLHEYIGPATPINQIETAVFDSNSINKLEHLETYGSLKKISLANNCLVEVRAIVKLQNLQYLNLLNNSLINIDALKDLKLLAWLNISGNEIKNFAALKNCHYLKHIEASDNSISELSDLSALNELHTLNLNGNMITTLKPAGNYLPKCLKYLFIANNAIDDLNEICYLSSLNELEALEFQNNPCVELKYNDLLIDYRPFVLNWCLTLTYLDGTYVTKKESLKAEWLYSQGKGRNFRPGQHGLLLEYLSKHCSLNSIESLEEIRLSKILEKQQNHVSESHSINNTNNSNNYYNAHNQHQLEYSTSPSILQQQQQQQQSHNPRAPTVLPFSGSTISNQQQHKSLAGNNNNNTSFEDSDIELLNSETEFLPVSNNNQQANIMKEKFELDFNSFGSKSSDLIYSNFHEKMQNLNRNSNPYQDYDSRPIKPLNENNFQKQLQEYKELSEEEISMLKKKAAMNVHARSKTVDNAKIKTTLKALKQHQQKQQPQISNQQEQEQIPPNNKFNYKKRSKTNDEIKLTNINMPDNNFMKQLKSTSSTGIGSSSNPTVYNADNYSPRNNEKALKLNELNAKMNKHVYTLKANAHFKSKPASQQLPIAKNSIHKSRLSNTSTAFHDRCATKIQAAWRGYYIRNCSIEIRKKFELLKYKRILGYLRYLRDNLNDLIDEHKQFCELNYEAFNTLTVMLVNINSNEKEMKQPQIKTAVKQIEVAKLKNGIEFENSKILLKENLALKQKIKALEDQCKEFEKKLMESTNSNNIVSQFESNSRISLTTTQTTQTSFEFKSNDENLKHLATATHTTNTGELMNYTDHTTLSNYDNTTLNEQFLSPKISPNSKNVSPSHHQEQQMNIYPPLRVRLQKVNEKSVALKWDHNQLNSEISGYRIFINNTMRGAVKPTDLKALINGIQEEGEYKITVRTFYENIESNDSNTVITRVKKLLNKSRQDNSLNESDATIQNNKESNIKNDTNSPSDSSNKKKSNDTSPSAASQQQQQSTIAPIIMDKIKTSSQSSPNNTFLGSSSNSTASNQQSAGNEKQTHSPPKREKILHNLLKERVLEKPQQQTNQKQLDDNNLNTANEFQDLASRLAKYSNLNINNEKSRSPSKSPEEFVHEAPQQLPFSNSTNFIQNRDKLKSAAININTSVNTKSNIKDKLLGSPKDLSSLINYKPPISPSTPPRVSSPVQSGVLISPIKINNYVSNMPSTNNSNLSSSKASTNSYGFEVNKSSNLLPTQVNVSKHKPSKSVDLSFSINQIKQNQEDNQNIKNDNKNTNNMSLTSNDSVAIASNITSNQKNFMVKSAKFSISEPNLASSITKSESSLKLGNSNNKLDFVRQSLSFDDDDDDDEGNKADSSNNLVHYNNKENEQINVQRAKRIFMIRNKLLDDQKNAKPNKNEVIENV